MPAAPASKHKVAARVTLGMPKWRVLRTKATLLRLTDKAVRGEGLACCVMGRSKRLQIHHHLARAQSADTAMVVQQGTQLGLQGIALFGW